LREREREREGPKMGEKKKKTKRCYSELSYIVTK
jgi:hypothetical protein